MLVKYTRSRHKEKEEFSYLTPILDFTPIFNWNTKQVFVTVVADYQTDKFVRFCYH
jgi:signal peptidase complex subunit 3